MNPDHDPPLVESVQMDAPLGCELSAGPVVISGDSANQVLVCVTKAGVCHLIDVGKNERRLGPIIDSIQACATIPSLYQNSRPGQLDSAPASWNERLYSWGEADYLKVFNVAGHKLSPEARSLVPAPPADATPTLSISSDGGDRETGIVWTFARYLSSEHYSSARGIIRAFKAADLAELWNSEQRSSRDRIGFISSQCPPTVANGRLFAPSSQELASGTIHSLSVYGLLPASGPPAPDVSTDFWRQVDVGTPIVGSMRESRGTITVTAGGDDIEQFGDSCHFVYHRLSGDGRIVARVVNLFGRNLHPWAKAGVMMRQTLEPDSRQATMFITPVHGTAFQHRLDRPHGFWHASGPMSKVPVWVRLVRDRTAVTGAVSLDGSNWQIVATARIPFGAEVYTGLVVSAHQGGPLADHVASAVFDCITLSP
jgi:hypothetical protein